MTLVRWRRSDRGRTRNTGNRSTGCQLMMRSEMSRADKERRSGPARASSFASSEISVAERQDWVRRLHTQARSSAAQVRSQRLIEYQYGDPRLLPSLLRSKSHERLDSAVTSDGLVLRDLDCQTLKPSRETTYLPHPRNQILDSPEG